MNPGEARNHYLDNLKQNLEQEPARKRRMRLRTLLEGFGFQARRRVHQRSLQQVYHWLGEADIEVEPALDQLDSPGPYTLITLLLRARTRGRRGRSTSRQRKTSSPSSVQEPPPKAKLRERERLPQEDMTLIETAIALAQIDDSLNRQEVRFINDWLLEECDWYVPRLALRHALKSCRDQRRFRGMNNTAEILSRHFQDPAWIWSKLADLARSDGPLHWRERLFLYELGQALRLPDEQMASLDLPSLEKSLDPLWDELCSLLGQGASPEEARQAWLRIALVVHPDRHESPKAQGTAEELFKILQQLHHLLHP